MSNKTKQEIFDFKESVDDEEYDYRVRCHLERKKQTSYHPDIVGLETQMWINR